MLKTERANEPCVHYLRLYVVEKIIFDYEIFLIDDRIIIRYECWGKTCGTKIWSLYDPGTVTSKRKIENLKRIDETLNEYMGYIVYIYV